MGVRSRLVFFIFIVFFLLMSCGGGNNSAASDDTAVANQPSDDSAPNGFGVAAQWPDYIPDDIPPLEGSIRLVMTGSPHVRIFYESVTEKQIKRYLDKLEQMGFQLEFMVYTQEGFPDNSEEKLARGAFDAVDITKDAYHMRLEAGGGTAVYDIYTTGFEVPVQDSMPPVSSPPTAVPLQWPENTSVPPPDSCELTSVLSINADQTMINCQFATKDPALDYIAQLQAAGFTEQDKFEDASGNLIRITLTKGDTAVSLMNSIDSALVIQIQPAD